MHVDWQPVLRSGCVSGGLSGTAAAADDAKPAAAPPIAATVNGDPIYVSEVNAAGAQDGASAAMPIRPPPAATIGRHAAADHQPTAGRTGAEARRRLLHRRGNQQSARDHEDQGGDPKDDARTSSPPGKASRSRRCRHESIWQIGWTRYVERHLADEMESYFKAHQKEFDGTQVRASHILLRPERSTESSAQTGRASQSNSRANRVRQAHVRASGREILGRTQRQERRRPGLLSALRRDVRGLRQGRLPGAKTDRSASR